MTAADIDWLAADVGLTPIAPCEEWEDIANRLTAAFAGYAAGSQREAEAPSNLPLREWGAALAKDAQRLIARIGFDKNADDPREGTWRTSELVAEVLGVEPDANTSAIEALAELERHLAGHGPTDADHAGGPDAEHINILIQRSLFQLIPTLQVLALAGDKVDAKYGGLIRRGGRTSDQSTRWAFLEIVKAFKALFGETPNISPPGGRHRHHDSIHLRWFLALLKLAEQRVAGLTSAEAEAIRDLTYRGLDTQTADKNHDRLRAWICAATGNV